MSQNSKCILLAEIFVQKKKQFVLYCRDYGKVRQEVQGTGYRTR